MTFRDRLRWWLTPTYCRPEARHDMPPSVGVLVADWCEIHVVGHRLTRQQRRVLTQMFDTPRKDRP